MKKSNGSRISQPSATNNGDDSSDEEEIAIRRSKYDIHKTIAEYTVQRGHNSYAQGSLLAHAAGVELLYSEKVNARHYAQKAEILGPTILPSEEKMQEWLATTISKSIAEVLYVPSQNTATKALTKAFLEENATVIQQTTQALLQQQRSLLRQRHHQTPLPALNEALSPLKQSLQAFINVIPARKDLVFATMNTLSARKLAQDPKIRAALSDQQRAITFLDNHGLLSPADKSKTLTSNQKSKPNMKKRVDELKVNRRLSFEEAILLDVVNDGISGYVSSKLSAHQAKLAEAACVDFIQAELGRRQHSVLFETRAAHTNDPVTKEYEFTTTPNLQNSPLRTLQAVSPEAFAQFLPYSADRLREEIAMQMGEFSGIFVSRLAASRKELGVTLERTILPEQHSFRSNNATEFLANIRLSNRSQIRHIRQAQEEEGNTIQGETVSRGWQFAGVPHMALETQEITTNGARTDLVVNLGNYKAVSDEIRGVVHTANSELEKKFTGKSIARWVRQIINGEMGSRFTYTNGDEIPLSPAHRKQLQKLCVNLASLILGTESARNPASLITQQMMLDLIISGDLSWETALADEAKKQAYGGGAMPMSMGTYEGGIKKEGDSPSKLKAEPVPCARKLQEEYGPYLVHPYRYPGESQSNSSKTEELRKREFEIVKKWADKFAPKANTLAETITKIREKRESSWYKS